MTKNISTIIEPHPFTIDDYQRMVDTGILEEDSKVELLAGQIVKMSPIGRFHAACIIRLNKILVIGLGDDYMVSVKSSIILDDQSQPEPDFAILKPKADAYQSGLPYPPETVVVIEVADSS
ncbi:MAG: Uma2 family endonuclease, partial [Bacteroidota bacterium]